MSTEKLESKRWWIAVGAVIIQLCLGTVYAWSVFKNPLKAMHGWGETQVQITFMICIGTIGIAAAFGGILVDKKGPRFVATIGGILFGVGTLLAGLADQLGSIWLMYLGFGLIAGLGNGFGYVTPIATLIRWFPDKRGLVTGLAVMGFGAGAFFMGRIAPSMINGFQTIDEAGTLTASGVSTTFYIWGAIFLVLVTASAMLFKNPPKGWAPAGFTPSAGKATTAASSYTLQEASRTPQWWMLWGMLFLNVSAGLGLLSQLSPMAQGLYRARLFPGVADLTPEQVAALAVAGGTVVAVSSIFNGVGRLFWAWTSDAIGRRMVFVIMFVTQCVLYILVPQIGSTVLFIIVVCYLLACYGGGFATMPAFAADSFGPAYIGRVYGTILTAWGAAGVAGPLVFAQLKGAVPLYVAAGLLVVGLILALLYKRPASKEG
ncbi:MAG: OFA family MFS transporter [Bradymonadales bacterium]|nr:OFA family MFS transporter [Bradymonadales bacterium]